MNILYLTPKMKIGGEELSTLTLTREMLKRGHHVTVKGDEGPMTPEFIKTGADVHISPQLYRRTLSGVLDDAMDIRSIINQKKIDIVHSQSVFPAVSSYIAIRGLRAGSRPRLIFHERGIGRFSYHIIPRVSNYLVDCVITNSDYEAAILKKNGLKVPCIRVHNSTNADTQKRAEENIRAEFGIAKNSHVLGIVGRLTEEKGHLVLLETFRRVLNDIEVRNVVLLIVGDGPLRERITQKVHELSLGRNVIFTGFRRDLEKVYPALDMLIVPSSFETFGNVAVEASSWGIPVIATAVGGLPEALCHGESGLLVPPGDLDALANSIRHLLNNPDIARKLGARGKELALTYFTPKRVADEVEAVYNNLLYKSH